MSEPYDRPRWDDDDEADRSLLRSPGQGAEEDSAPEGAATEQRPTDGGEGADELERASENVLEGWPEPVDEPLSGEDIRLSPDASGVAPAHEAGEQAPSHDHPPAGSEHAPGDLVIPPGVPVLEGVPRGERRAVGIVVSRFNGEVTSRLLESAIAELDALDVDRDSVTVMPVPGAFELPLAAMALAKTRRFACIVALGCVVRGDTPHFDFICAEAASGVQLAGIETGVPVAFGVLTLDRAHQADARLDKGAEAVRTALEMADLFANLRAAAAR